jgi:hypothetical protein
MILSLLVISQATAGLVFITGIIQEMGTGFLIDNVITICALILVGVIVHNGSVWNELYVRARLASSAAYIKQIIIFTLLAAVVYTLAYAEWKVPANYDRKVEYFYYFID